jgi:hypothetical protein
MSHPVQINTLILEQLAGGEKGLLRLIVAVRKNLGRFEKGDLAEIIRASLHKLVVSEVVVDVDGMYSLAPSHRPTAAAASSR